MYKGSGAAVKWYMNIAAAVGAGVRAPVYQTIPQLCIKLIRSIYVI